jgi:GrpB-like predicted nucleotidyltransferase (UPF0157 family)/GNAT superfamily N-acetyltransferase
MNVDEKIHLEAYNSNWKKYFNQEKTMLEKALKGNFLGIEHFGSTSIPDMMAKPIIDILIGIVSFPMPDIIIRKLEENGYQYMEKASVIGRSYFVKRTGQPFNVHVVEYEKEIWNDNLILRNYFVAHKDDAQKYAKLKQEIINHGVDTLLEYSVLKGDFIKRMLQNAHETMFETKVITKESQDFQHIIELYKNAFPVKEQRNIDSIFYDKTGMIEVLAFYERNHFCGFACTLIHLDICYILYLAIEDSLRGNGYGSKVLKELAIRYPDKRIVLDIEKEDENAPNNIERIKRKNFYLKNGYMELQIDSLWRNISFEALSLNGNISNKEYNDFWFYIEKNTQGLI